MKRSSIIVGAVCVPIILLVAACSSGATQSARTGAIKEAGQSRTESSFLRGDADGNGAINIEDVTLIQRVLAEMEADSDGKIAMRGDIDGNGLDVNDVTMIMRFLADYQDHNGVGNLVAVEDSSQPEETKDATSAAESTAQNGADATNAVQTSTAQATDAAQQTAPPATNAPETTRQQEKPTAAQPEATETTSLPYTLGENELPPDYL